MISIKLFVFFVISLFTLNTFAKTKVAIIDAFFCESNYIKKAYDFTDENNPFKNPCIQNRSTHGNAVFSTIVKNLLKPDNIEFYLFKVYNKDGSQNVLALKKSVKEILNLKIDLVVMAIGFINLNDPNLKIPTLTFAASGVSGNGVSLSDELWPQSLTSENLVIFSHYFPSITGDKMSPSGHLDPTSLYKNKLDYLLDLKNNSNELLNGSSLSIALATAKFLNYCSPSKARECLNKYSTDVLIKSFAPYKKFKKLK